MKENYEIAPSVPNTVKRISSKMKWAGLIGFWLQLVLGVVSLVIWLLSVSTPSNRTPGTEVGIFFAACGLVALGIAIYFFFRYIKIARLLNDPDPALRPRKPDTLRVIRLGLIVNIVGLALTIIGAEASIGIVLAKSLSRPQLALGSDPKEFVNSLDLLIVQSNINTIAAHFAGILSSLWLLNRITK